MTGDDDAGRCENSAVDISEKATHSMVPRRPERVTNGALFLAVPLENTI